jgi:hypothetical protein
MDPIARTRTLRRSFAMSGLATLAVLVAAPLAAQAVRALPRSATDAYAGSTAFAIPPTAFHAQYWFDGQNLPVPLLVQSIGIRIARNASAAASSRAIEIVVANTPVTFGGVTATFAQNLGPSPVTFVARRTINFAAVPATSDPNVAAAWFPGDVPFVHVGQNFVVDFKGGASTGGALVRNDGFVMAPGATETLHLAGRASCGGVLTGVYASGVFTLAATGLPVGVPAVFQIGVENVAQGALALPFDLAVIGMPGCHLGVFALTSVAATSNANGRAALPIPFTAPLASSVMLSSQAVHPRVPVPQSLADFGTTNAVHSTFFFAGLCNSLYADGENATVSTQGPQPVNNAIVVLLR